MKTKNIIYGLAAVLLMISNSCDREWNNPFDPDSAKETWTPSNFSVSQVGEAMQLSWSQPISNISGFKIDRRVGNGPWENVSSPDKTVLSWIDNDLANEQIHEYRLYAYAGENESNTITASETPALPNGTFIDPRDGHEYEWVRIGGRKWMAENLKYRFSEYDLSSNKINGSNNSTNQLLNGTIIAYQTNEGRAGKMQIQQYGYDLKIRWITYNNDGTVFSEGDNLTIRGFWSCDLDAGIESTKNSDFWWEQVTEEERYLTPKNNASFAIYHPAVDFENVAINNGIYSYDNNRDNLNTYGYLYNWYTANSGNLCPQGWHLPSDDEWKELEISIGMSQSEANNSSWRGTNEGGKLKETGTLHWSSPNTGATNGSGFTALPGGKRQGQYQNLRQTGSFWSSTENSLDKAWSRQLGFDHAEVFRDQNSKVDGLSIRCVQD